MLASDVSHYSCVDTFLIIDCKALNFSRWGITTNHWGITTRSKVTTGNYQPGSYTPVKPFEPPTHWDTNIYIYIYIYACVVVVSRGQPAFSDRKMGMVNCALCFCSTDCQILGNT